MGSSGYSKIPQQRHLRVSGLSFFLFTDVTRKQISKVSQGPGKSPLGSGPERGLPDRPPQMVPLALPPVAILLIAPRWRCRTTALSRPQPKVPRVLPWEEDTKRLNLKLKAWLSLQSLLEPSKPVDSKASSKSLTPDVTRGKVLRAWLGELTQASPRVGRPVLPSVPLPRGPPSP